MTSSRAARRPPGRGPAPPDAEVRILEPWGDELTPARRAAAYFDLVERVYAGTYPVRSYWKTPRALARDYAAGRFSTWFATWRGHVVATVSAEQVGPRRWSVVSSAALPPGFVLAPGVVYPGHVSPRLLLEHRMAALRAGLGAHVVEGDVRLAAARGSVRGGAAAQEIHARLGLSPFLFCVPRFRYLRPTGGEVVECFQGVRWYGPGARVRKQDVWHVREEAGASLATLLRTAYDAAGWGEPRTEAGRRSSVRSWTFRLDRSGKDQFHRLRVAGAGSLASLRSYLRDSLERTRFLEVVVPNTPDAPRAVASLSELRAIPLGVEPGYGRTPAAFALGLVGRSRGDATLCRIQFAARYAGTDVERLSNMLHSQWEMAFAARTG